MPEWCLGTIGFGYTDWKGSFYPPEIKSIDYLTYYSRSFNSVELDTTFYGVPRSNRIQQWCRKVPENFLFCAKTPRIITHKMGLVGARGIMEEFITILRVMEKRLGVILIQLPPGFAIDSFDRLEKFLNDLPDGVRYAVELRHNSWYCDRTQAMLRARGIALVALEYPKLPKKIYPTADFLYIRWIGQHGSYNRHSHERVDKTPQLAWWKEYVLDIGGDVERIYGFFNNDYAGFAAGTCLKFKELLGLPIERPGIDKQGRLF